MRIRLMIVAALLLPVAASAGELKDAVAAIKAVKREGAGNEAAAGQARRMGVTAGAHADQKPVIRSQ